MNKTKMMKAAFAMLFLIAAALAGGCGGRGSGGVAALPPASPADRGTLKFANVPAKTVIIVDGQQIPMASGTVTVSVAPGVHDVVVSRTGYIVSNSADIARTPVAVNSTTEKALSFTREQIPLPGDWVETPAARVAGEPDNENPAPPPLPQPDRASLNAFMN